MDPLTLSRDMSAAALWWASLEPEQRRTCYRPAELQALTGIARANLPHVLELLGWHRAQRWTREAGRRRIRTYYAPPGHHVPKPPRGRPSLDVLALLAIERTDPYDLFPR